MEDKWKQKFKDKFDGFQPETVIPEFVSAAPKKTTPIWLHITAAAAAISTVVIYIYTFHDHGSIDSPYGSRLIAEPVAVLQDRPVLLLARPLSISALREKASSTPQIEPIISSPISQSEVIAENVEETEIKDNGSRRDATSRREESEGKNTSDSSETLSVESITPISFQVRGAPFIRKTNEVHSMQELAGTSIADTVYSFHLPLKASISLCYNITPSLSLESGVCYRYQSATWIFRVNNSVAEQAVFHQHFVGIPLRINYRLYEHDKMSVYASIGEETLFRIHGTEELSYYTEKTITRKLEKHPFTCSLNVAAGLDYRLTPSVSLYAEPGIAWHFIRTWDAPDYYQKHPLSFDLNVGLRVRLLD